MPHLPDLSSGHELPQRPVRLSAVSSGLRPHRRPVRPAAADLSARFLLPSGPVHSAELSARPDPAAKRTLHLPRKHDLHQRPVRAAQPVSAGRDQSRRHLLLSGWSVPARQPVLAVLLPRRPSFQHRPRPVRTDLLSARPVLAAGSVQADRLPAEPGAVQQQVRSEVPAEPGPHDAERRLRAPALWLPDRSVQRQVRAALSSGMGTHHAERRLRARRDCAPAAASRAARPAGP